MKELLILLFLLSHMIIPSLIPFSFRGFFQLYVFFSFEHFLPCQKRNVLLFDLNMLRTGWAVISPSRWSVQKLKEHFPLYVHSQHLYLYYHNQWMYLMFFGENDFTAHWVYSRRVEALHVSPYCHLGGPWSESSLWWSLSSGTATPWDKDVAFSP